MQQNFIKNLVFPYGKYVSYCGSASRPAVRAVTAAGSTPSN